MSGYLCVCPPLACSLCPLQVFVFSSSLFFGLPFLLPECSLSPSGCISLSIWLSVSPRAGCLYEFFSTSVSSFAGNYVTLSNASQREVCEGFGTDNEYQTPANLFVTRLQSPRRADIEGLLALFSLSVSLSVDLPVCIIWCSQFNFNFSFVQVGMRDLSQFLKMRPIRFFHQFINIKREFFLTLLYRISAFLAIWRKRTENFFWCGSVYYFEWGSSNFQFAEKLQHQRCFFGGTFYCAVKGDL